MNKRRMTQLVSATMIAAVYLLVGSPVAAQYKVISLTGENNVQADQVSTSATKAVTADISFCKGSVGPFAIRGVGTPFTTTVFKVTQTVQGILGFSNSLSSPFTDTIDVTVNLGADGSGQSEPFYMSGVNLGQTVLSICNDQQQCPINQASSIVVNVANLEWEMINSPLDANSNAGGDLRIFPDKASPDDTMDRTAVLVKAKLSAEMAGRNIYLKAFDVDDPSSDNTVVDSTGAGGADNRGNTADVVTVRTVTTGPDGVASFTFNVSKQPGDNFRIAGTCLRSDMDGLTVSGTEVKDPAGQVLPTDRAGITPMLTVWRRVHVEVDSMGPVTGNRVTGTIRRARPDTTTNMTKISFRGRLEPGRFKGGLMKIDGLGAGTVFDNTRNTVTIHGVVQNAVAAGRSYELVDDDDFNDDDGGALDGDAGENVTAPDTSLIQDSDNPAENVFAPAYVRPIYDIGDNNDLVPFVLNVAADTPAGRSVIYDFDTVGTEANPDFWTVYLLGAYQYTTEWDADPDGENPLGIIAGTVDEINGRGASVFSEVLRPREAAITATVNKATTTAHEIGHLFNGLHGDGGLMSNSSTSFTEITLNKIRGVMHP